MATQVIGEHYEVQEQIGVGSVGATFAVFDVLSRAKLALKCLRPLGDETSAAKASLDRHKERFAREVTAMITLDHPSVVPIYDCDLETDNPYYVMELCSRGSLEDLIGRQEMGQTEIMNTLWPICAALQHAHAKGVVHRDIKPANILFTSTGRPKICDFGMCRIADWHCLTYGQDSMLGTLYYLPPEQSQDPQSADARSDIFSLGRTIRHMLVGSPIGTDPPSVAATPQKRQSMKPWDAVIGEMTALARNRRPRSMQAVGRLLEPLSKNAKIGEYAKRYRKALLEAADENPPEPLHISPDDFARLTSVFLTPLFMGHRPPRHEDAKWLSRLSRRLALSRRSAPLASFILASYQLAWGTKPRGSARSRRRLLLAAQIQALSILGPDGAKLVREFSKLGGPGAAHYTA